MISKGKAMTKTKKPDDPELSTYFELASMTDPEDAIVEASEIVGSKHFIGYPAAADWSSPRLPDEPPLNEDISAVEPVGTPAEIEASIEALRKEQSNE
jgi:hypothetical protein